MTKSEVYLSVFFDSQCIYHASIASRRGWFNVTWQSAAEVDFEKVMTDESVFKEITTM